MGFIQFATADEYVLGAPLFKKVTLNLENGKQLIINAQIILIKINMSKS
jgi:putative alpha-1,2-mannosidase